MGSSGHVACMGGMRNKYKFYFIKQCIDEMIILKYMLEKISCIQLALDMLKWQTEQW